ncbi:hypothetical protein P5V15_001266 [Pogonomyrmex californicus]
MIFNPINVIRLLLASISSIYLMETPIIETKIELKKNIQKLLLDSIFYHNGLEITEKMCLDFQKHYKLHTFKIIEDDEEAWSEDNLNIYECLNDNVHFDSSYSGELHKFRRMSSERQLERWKEQLQSHRNRMGKLSYISQFTHNKFTAAVQSDHIIHDVDLKTKLNPMFKASDSWIAKFKKSHRIVSRKIIKFVTRKTLEDSVDLQKNNRRFFKNSETPH